MPNITEYVSGHELGEEYGLSVYEESEDSQLSLNQTRSRKTAGLEWIDSLWFKLTEMSLIVVNAPTVNEKSLSEVFGPIGASKVLCRKSGV